MFIVTYKGRRHSKRLIISEGYVKNIAETIDGVPFALSPALVHSKDPIDYRTTEGNTERSKEILPYFPFNLTAHQIIFNSPWMN